MSGVPVTPYIPDFDICLELGMKSLQFATLYNTILGYPGSEALA